MSEQSNLISYLKERGYRVTPQRAIILQAVEGLSGHVTAEEIFGVVQQTSAYISLATVYRTLDLLKELNLVSESSMGTATTHYALRKHGTHHHAVCRKCNRVIVLPHDLFDPIVDQLHADQGFVVDANHLVVYGWCQDCQAEMEQELNSAEV